MNGIYPPSYVVPSIHPPAIAMYDYTPDTELGLSFRIGDIIEVFEKDETSGWWEGATLNPFVSPRASSSVSSKESLLSRRGAFPSNFVVQSKRVQTLYDYRATAAEHLSFVEGEIIEVFSEDESGWWEGRILGFPGKRGLFPSNFVKEQLSFASIDEYLESRLWVRTVAGYSSTDEGYLNFKKDERILVITKHDSGWWSGRIDENRVGRFPSNYISENVPALPTPINFQADLSSSMSGSIKSSGSFSFNNNGQLPDFSEETVVPKGKSKSLYKVIMVGDSGVGKTGLYHRYERQSFVHMTPATVGADFVSKVYKLNSGECVKVQLWDTAGQERYQTVTKLYYHGALGAILVYDVTKRNSLEHITKWLKELKIHGYNDKMLFMLVGNKSDLSASREVRWDDGNAFAQEHQMTCFFETSALTGQNTASAFSTFLQEIHRVVLADRQPFNTGQETITLDSRFGVVPTNEIDNNHDDHQVPKEKILSLLIINNKEIIKK